MAHIQINPGYCEFCGAPIGRCKDVVLIEQARAALYMEGVLSIIDKATIARRGMNGAK